MAPYDTLSDAVTVRKGANIPSSAASNTLCRCSTENIGIANESASKPPVDCFEFTASKTSMRSASDGEGLQIGNSLRSEIRPVDLGALGLAEKDMTDRVRGIGLLFGVLRGVLLDDNPETWCLTN